MKCRGCGKDTRGVNVPGVGWMHVHCEVKRQQELANEEKGETADDSVSKVYCDFIRAVVWHLTNIRDNPTPARIDNLLVELQAFLLDQD